MIALTVLSYNGVPAEPLTATFDELGGTIGRSDNNQLVLADPERTISRVHARVVFRASGFAIVDNGSNPIVVNGQPVGSGSEHPLAVGDEVQIGGYLLKVGTAGGVPASDPFADLFGDGALGLAAPGPKAAPAAAPVAPTARAPSAAGVTGFGGGGSPWSAPSAPAAAPWPPPAPAPAWPPAAQAAAWPPAASAPAWPPAPTAPSAASAIPDDWDPFGSDHPAPPAARSAPGSATATGALGLSGTADPSLDDLFGLGGAGPAASGDLLAALAPTPATAPPQDRPPVQPGVSHAAMPGAVDGFGFDDAFDPAYDKPRAGAAMRGGGVSAAPASRPDHVSELNTPMPLPAVESTARVLPSPAAADAVQALFAPAPPATVQPSALPSGAILSWEDPPRDGKVVTLPGVFVAPQVPPAAAAALPTDFGLDLDFDVAPPPPSSSGPPPTTVMPPAARPASSRAATAGAPAAGVSMSPVLPPERGGDERARPPEITTPFARSVAAVPAPEASPPAARAGGAAAAELQRAFAEGLGVPGLRLAELDAAQMHLLGQLLREAVRGTVELLVARAALKREMRAEVTMIVARENNPLKFSPTVEVALQHVLGTPTPGFMAPAAAMRDAFDDLRAHQLGVMAGMRAALEGVLGRFDPQQLEGKLTRRSAIDSLIPATRKARLWESFQELFAQLQREAQDDFDELFGRAFLQAYEAQLDRLHGEPGPR